jgi:hypothetical protein
MADALFIEALLYAVENTEKQQLDVHMVVHMQLFMQTKVGLLVIIRTGEPLKFYNL